MIRVKMPHRGRRIEDFIADLQGKVTALQDELYKIVSKVGPHMADIIDRTRERPSIKTGVFGDLSLAEHFRTVKPIIIPTKEGISISWGDTRYLDTYFPYWWIINYGGPLPMADIRNAYQFIPGYFEGEEKRVGRRKRGKQAFYYTPYARMGGFRITTATSRIKAKNYIEQTQNWLDAKWRTKIIEIFKRRQLVPGVTEVGLFGFGRKPLLGQKYRPTMVYRKGRYFISPKLAYI